MGLRGAGLHVLFLPRLLTEAHTGSLPQMKRCREGGVAIERDADAIVSEYLEAHLTNNHTKLIVDVPW